MTQPKTASKHTPGSWHVQPLHFVYYEIAEFVKRVKASGQYPKDEQIQETDANARLIAAAPEMYELLERIAGAPIIRKEEKTVDFAARLLGWWLYEFTIDTEARRIKAEIDADD